MKKGVIFLLAIVYITLTSGVAVNIHYCMGKIAGVTYGVEGDHQCDNCGMEKKAGCCDTEHKLVKAGDDHLFSPSISAKAPDFTAVTSEFFAYDAPVVIMPEQIIPRYHAPPGIPNPDLCVLNSVFRI